MASQKQKNKSGPEPERIKLNKPWEKAVGDALRKKRPAEGWPDQPTPDVPPLYQSHRAGRVARKTLAFTGNNGQHLARGD